MQTPKGFTLAAAVVVSALFVPSRAHAYVDPGILGQLYHLIYVGIFGGLAAIVTKPHRYIAARWKARKAKQQTQQNS